MLQDWEAGFVGNNPGVTAALPRKVSTAWVPGRVIVNLVRGRRVRSDPRERLPSAA